MQDKPHPTKICGARRRQKTPCWTHNRGMGAKKRIARYTRQPARPLQDTARPRHAYSYRNPNSGRRSKQSSCDQVVLPAHPHTQVLRATQIGHCKRAKQHARRHNHEPGRRTISSRGQQRRRPSTAGARATYSIMEHGARASIPQARIHEAGMDA